MKPQEFLNYVNNILKQLEGHPNYDTIEVITGDYREGAWLFPKKEYQTFATIGSDYVFFCLMAPKEIAKEFEKIVKK